MELASNLIESGLLTEVVQRDIHADEAHTAKEMFLTGGDVHMFAVVEWDGQPVGTGTVGPVAQGLYDLLWDDVLDGTSNHDKVVYTDAEANFHCTSA